MAPCRFARVAFGITDASCAWHRCIQGDKKGTHWTGYTDDHYNFNPASASFECFFYE